MIRKVMEKEIGMEDGAAHGPDKLLVGLVEKGRFYENEPATALFHIWLQSSDKEAVGQVLHLFTGVTFQDFLNGCLKQEGTGK